MKNSLSNYFSLKLSLNLWLVVIFCLLLICQSNTSYAQDNTSQEKQEPVRSRMSISVVQGEKEGIVIKALVRAKIDNRYIGLPGLEVNFAMTADSLEKELGQAITDKKGFAEYIVPLEQLYIDSIGEFHLMVTFDGNDKFKASNDDATFVLAKMMVDPVEEDSVKTMTISLESRGEPVSDEEVYLFVESYINPLKVGEGTTDEEGKVTIEFPGDLPGDTEGNVEIFAQLEDHDEFGTVVARKTQAWGIPVAKRADKLPRALWSPYPPLWLLLSFIAILLFIWGHYLEVIVKMVKLKRKAGTES